MELLESEMICTVSADSVVNQQIINKCDEYLKEKEISEIKFSILGPPHCGKTSILYHFALMFYRKLQLSDDADTVLMFPFNIEKNMHYINDPTQLYLIIVHILMDSLLFSRFQCWNSFLQLREWFFSIPTIGSLPSLPDSIMMNPFIDGKKLIKLGKKLHSAFKKSDESIEKMQSLLLSVPTDFAAIFGFDYVCFVVDHVKNISSAFSNALSEGIKKMPFIIAAIEDENFKNAFKKNSAPIYPENFCEVCEKRVIKIGLDAMEIDDCMGFPSYIHSFCEILSEAEDLQAVKKQLGGLTPAINRHRENLLKRKCLLLAESLAQAGNKRITPDFMSLLDDPNTCIVVA